MKSHSTPKIAFLLHNLGNAGLQKVVINLVRELSKNSSIELDIVVANSQAYSSENSCIEQIPDTVKVRDLNTPIEHRLKSYIRLLLAIIKYLDREKPDILVSNLPLANFLSIIARKFTLHPVQLFVVEHSFFLDDILRSLKPKKKSSSMSVVGFELLIPPLTRWLYPQAKGIIAVSQGLAHHIEDKLNLTEGSVKVIYNPVINDEILIQSNYPVENDWINDTKEPIFLSIGRLSFQKDHENLLQAFAQYKENSAGKLLILGEGELRSKLEDIIQELQLEDDVQLLGFMANPYAYLSKASALILSSLWEGLPTIIIEAIACGCQVISTDCPYGPEEILAGGEYGFLVPTRDVSALAQAMRDVLIYPKDPEKLKHRALDFTIEKAVSEYSSFLGIN